MSNFSFSRSVFYPYGELSSIFIEFKIVVCNLLQFGRVQNLSFGKVLTLYNTIPTFNDPEKESFWKHCGKRRKCWQPAFSLFPTMFSIWAETKIVILADIILSSANAFNFDQSKILLFGKELNVLSVVTFEFKKKNVTKNSKSKNRHNSGKNEFRVISLVCTYAPPFTVNMYSYFQVYMFSNGRNMIKCHSFCMTTTMKKMKPRLKQYLRFSPKTAKLKMRTVKYFVFLSLPYLNFYHKLLLLNYKNSDSYKLEA